MPSPVGKGELTEITERLRAFAHERDWEQFHTPKNLAASVAIEAAELQEIFQWLTDKESATPTEEQIRSAGREIADVAIYLIRLADQLGVDVSEEINAKIDENERRYPAEIVRGGFSKRP